MYVCKGALQAFQQACGNVHDAHENLAMYFEQFCGSCYKNEETHSGLSEHEAG